LATFGIEGQTTSSGASATFAIDKVTWRRLPDLTPLLKSQFIIEDVDFSVSGIVDKSLVQQVSAQVRNTGYTSFWQAKFTVILWQGDKIVGIGSTRFDQFRSGDTKSLIVAVNASGSPTRVEIFPDVNFLDDNNFIRQHYFFVSWHV
jgi:hypothetical protein